MNTIGFTHTNEVTFEGYTYLTTGADAFFRGCKRCGGTGHYLFNGFDDICYSCNNDSSARLGVFVGDEAGAKRDAHRRFKAREAGQAKKEAKRMVFIHQMEAKQDAVLAADPAVFAAVKAVEFDDKASSFMTSMYENLFFAINSARPFTANMIAAVRKAVDAKAEKDASAVPVPVTDARIVLTGVIVSTKIVDTEFGTAYKILFQDDRGFRVYGSLASNLQDIFRDEFAANLPEGVDEYSFGSGVWFTGSTNEQEFTGVKGKRITFSAKIQVSIDDKAFGFFSRPTKASVATAE